jgi:basic membrane protein A
VQTTFKENVPEGPQVSQVIDSLVREGNKIIFATSFGFQNAMFAAAQKYPDVKFEMATGTKQSKNMAEYFGAGEDAIYLSGMAAGAASKSGTIGYVVPFAIPEVIRHANAFALGAQATHPGVKVKLIWTNSWFSPDKEKKAAENLVAAGSDVLGQNVDSPAAGQFAESKGIPWVGYDSDARKFARHVWLTAAIYNWGPYYLRRVKAAANGSWKTGFYYGSLKDGFVGLAPYGPKVKASTKAAIARKRSALVKGSFYEFAGPLYDQKGKLRVPKGKRLNVKELYGMNWLVKGVIGSAKG